MSLYVVDIHGNIEGDYEIVKQYEKPRKVHWIRVTNKAGHLAWECDKCGWRQRFNTNYCPNCGAKGESEVEE